MASRRILFCFLVLLFMSDGLKGLEAEDDEGPLIGDDVPTAAEEALQVPVEPEVFVTPDPQGHHYFADAFKDQSGIGKKWYLSKAKKDGVDENIAKYNGEWEINQPEKVVLKNDYGLIIKTKARHHAIAANLNKPFEFGSKPLVVQYDVLFQNGQECGGAYVKLLSHTKGFDPETFHDKSPYTIMFGPDKCGLQSKYHFIIRYTNPKNGTISEHHAKQPDKSIESHFGDKKSHLFTLVLNPDGSYRTYVDQKEMSRGTLLENLEPPIVPPKEIEDPKDEKPKDWDEREKIPDPDATKPDDWDETAPEHIEDTNAKQPEGWLEEETEYVHDEKAVKPDDWDEEMDGKWEAPLIKNPKCEGVPGCGKWTPPKIKNPEYKGKWKPPMISNPNYKGKWKPRVIENPDYFEDSNPFSNLEPIGAIGLELWTMSDGIMFDNFIITDDKTVADSFAAATWLIKQSAESRLVDKASFFGGLVQAANEKPWLWAVYILVVLIPIVLITVFCCTGSKDDEGLAKKLDTSSPDVEEEEVEENTNVAEQAEVAAGGSPSSQGSKREASQEKSESEGGSDSAGESESVNEDSTSLTAEQTSEKGEKSKTSPRRRTRKVD